ncbi:MFS transporter [Kitasatospora sp. NPDC101183]|uniref:MFS transporter n=1 Tax=Kitasatospora sp. NPDC101183 TaxID=3364100 RepID=UPI00381A0BC1
MTQTAPPHPHTPTVPHLPSAFRTLLAGEAVSAAGSQFTLIAVPFLAATELDASASQLALLSGAQFLPALLVTPIAGKLADLHDRAPLLYLSHLARFALLVAVIVLAELGGLDYWTLFAASMLLGAGTALFDTALLAYVPDTVEPAELTKANGQLAVVYAVAQSAGPAAGGLLVSGLGPVLALGVDALSYAGGGAALRLRRRPARHKAARGAARIRDGFTEVLRNDPLRRLVSAGTLFNLAEQVALSVLFVAVVREADRSVALIGFGFSAAGLGSVAGAWASRRFGGGDGDRSWVWALALSQAALLAALWSFTWVRHGEPLFLATMLVYGLAIAFYNVHSLTRRQKLAPEGMLGRVNAVYRTLAYGSIPVGSALAALLVTVTTAPVAAAVAAPLSLLATAILARGTYTTGNAE